ncbi:Fic family protein [Labedella populi]|uniref:Fic family protein n=1 Tax=Labedella populi TaxID=2498850 RepID=A0A3S5CJ74_9MICO|nr:Fic family protein [Labedella populi]RWZ59656.1 Fic family protein [Labedella populi]
MDKYRLPSVDFDSPLVELSFELERFRGNLGLGTTRPQLIIELHSLFQILSSVISARIEGNRTTVYDAIRGPSGDDEQQSEAQREINNLLAAMRLIDELPPEAPLTHSLVREFHRMTVDGLTREGDPTPGSYRVVDVEILNSAHTPPSHVYVHSEMSDFLEFANRPLPAHQQMIHVAIAHHRFLWIHPFRNGNGRVSRLVTYFMIRRNGFVSPVGLRTVNPTAVFGNDRDEYYASLEAADDLSNSGTVLWCTFFARGVHDDLERLTKLQDAEYLSREVLAPTIQRMRESGILNTAESKALQIVFDQGVVKAGDLEDAFPGGPSARSVAIRAMVERGLLQRADAGPRFYTASLHNPVIGPFLVRRFNELGFLPPMLQNDKLE